jgi:chemotaxis protein CheD
MYDPSTRIGGMNHFLLPGEVGDQDLSTRYGVNAMEVLINEMMKLGANRKRFQAKVFGGADIFQANHPMLMVGTKNIAFVHHFLEVEGISIVNERVGGNVGVVIHYHAHAFDVMVKPMPTERFMETESEEERYRRRLTEDLRRGRQRDVTLF